MIHNATLKWGNKNIKVTPEDKVLNIERFTNRGVKPDGTFYKELGAVRVKAAITMSAPHGGCGMGHCNCSPGHWVLLGHPRDAKTKTVKGETLYFHDRKDLLTFTKKYNLKETAE
jgi:hypothetical protein